MNPVSPSNDQHDDANPYQSSSIKAPAGSNAGKPNDLSPVAAKYGRFNFAIIAIYQIVVRTGWIFKTESIVMPAVLDSIGGTGLLRGLLPPLNRFGQSIPPLLAARRIKNASRKKSALALSTGLMGICFLLLAGLWWARGPTLTAPAAWWLKYVFLILYAIFFVVVGINQLAFGTLNGKLVATHRRGRLMLVANIIGSLIAVTCAWLLLREWLRADGGNFVMIFGFSGTLFLAAALICELLREGRDRFNDRRKAVRHVFRDAWRTLRHDRDFARLSIVGATFGCSMVLFPHYQAIGRTQLGLDFTELLVWVVVQNLGTGFFSLPTGLIADRFGNRLVLRLLLLGLACGPLLTLALSNRWLPGVSDLLNQRLFALVFVLVGFTPIIFRILANYTLELTSNEHHPRYLSTLSLCIAAPVMILSPLAGWMVDRYGFNTVFIAVIALLFTGWCLIFTIREPRNDPGPHSDDHPTPAPLVPQPGN